MSKKLTQAVFDGLPPEYRWAAVDADGNAFAFNRHPPSICAGIWIAEVGYRRRGARYDATDWKNSLIERTESEENQELAEAQAEIQVLKKCLELVTAQRDALLEDNAHFYELLKKQRWISVADELPPLDGTQFLGQNGSTIMVLSQRIKGRYLVEVQSFDDHVEQHRTSFKPTHGQHRPAPPESV